MNTTTEVWYRVDDWRTAPVLDEWEQPIGSGRSHISILSYPVKRHTPKGVVLDVYGNEKLVCHHWRKKYACATVEEAKVSFLARKNRQASILKAQLKHVEDALKLFHADKFI